MAIEFLTAGPGDGPTLILAHGAGAAMDSEFMNVIAAGLGNEGIRVLRFEFPYMAGRRADGKRRPPDREAVLLDTWRQAVRESGAERPFIGGKSMGGRMASMVADEIGAAGLLCFGYPFHPPGRPERLRTAHLEHLQTRALILQGTRDTFGTREDVAGYALSPSIAVHWIEGGNHDLRAPVKTKAQSWGEAVGAAAAFVNGA